MDEDFEQKWDILQELISIQLASTKIIKLTINQGKNKFNLYPPISIFISAPRSSLKTTLIKQVANLTGHKVIDSVTPASLYGSIRPDGSGALISPLWEYNNSIMPIDEFNKSGPESHIIKQTFLNLTEMGEISKLIAYSIQKPVSMKNDYNKYSYYNISEGKIDIKINVGFIFTSMITHQSDEFNSAFMSRLIPFKYSIEDVRSIFNGDININLKDYKVRKKEVTILTKDWNIIKEYVLEETDDMDSIDKSLIIRIVGYLCKIFAVLQKHDHRLYDVVIRLKRWDGYINLTELKTDEVYKKLDNDANNT